MWRVRAVSGAAGTRRGFGRVVALHSGKGASSQTTASRVMLSGIWLALRSADLCGV